MSPCGISCSGVLADACDDTKLLAGGQSPIPLLNMRLAKPARLIDLGCVPELVYIAARPARPDKEG